MFDDYGWRSRRFEVDMDYRQACDLQEMYYKFGFNVAVVSSDFHKFDFIPCTKSATEAQIGARHPSPIGHKAPVISFEHYKKTKKIQYL